MHDRKQKDYGTAGDPFANVRASADFGIPGWVGCMTRANDKMKRLQKAARGGTMTNESVEDSLLDLAVYAIIALVLRREEQDGGTGLQEGVVNLDTGQDGYFSTGARCSAPFVGGVSNIEGRSVVGICTEDSDVPKRRSKVQWPSGRPHQPYRDFLTRKTGPAGRTQRDGVPDVAGMDIST